MNWSLLALLPASEEGSWVLLAIYFFFTVAVSFCCSLCEASLLSITPPYIAKIKKSRPKAGKRLEELKSHVDRPLISILTLNTIANTLGAMAVASELTKLAKVLPGGNLINNLGGFVMTLVILIGAEVIPKNLGARKWKEWGPWVGNCIHWLTQIMKPIVHCLRFFSRGSHSGDSFSREEITVMAEMGKMEGELKEEESRIITNLLTLRDVTVYDIMTPRVIIFSLKETVTIGEYVKKHGQSEYSRIPLYLDNKDEITGIVLKDEILLKAARDELDVPLGNLKKEVSFMSDVTSLPKAFEDFVSVPRRLQAAVVLDEFGGVTGLVTMEDIVETLLGLEIMDERDKRGDLRDYARKRWEDRCKARGYDWVTKDDVASQKFSRKKQFPVKRRQKGRGSSPPGHPQSGKSH